MTLMEFTGCATVAYGPGLVLFLTTIMKDPVRIIILIASAFFWLSSFLFSSIVWHLIPFESALIPGVIVSVILQEIFRYLLYVVLRKAEAGLKKVYVPNMSTEMTNNKHILSYVAGLGFGLMSGAFSLVNLLAEIAGPGTIGLDGSPPYFCLISAAFTLCFILLHTFWSIIFFPAVDSKNYQLLSWVVISHLTASLVTLLNMSHLYLVTLLPVYLILIVNAFIAFRVAGGSYNTRLCCAGRQLNIVPDTE